MTFIQALAFLGLVFIVTVLGCCFALGKMHRWLLDRGLAFGAGATPHDNTKEKPVQVGPWGNRQK